VAPRPVAQALLAAGVAALLGGCGNSGAEQDVRDAASRFVSALEQRDGAAACDELSEHAQSTLEQEERKPCEEAVTSLEPAPARVASAEVWMTSARADLEAGGPLFLNRTSAGWKIGAVGCEARPGRPYECELEG
jgi:hypothetical protein